MKVLVTGGAGFIGSHTTDLLVERGYDVTILDNLDPQVHGSNAKVPPWTQALIHQKKIRFLRGDVRDRGLMTPLVDEVDAVIHLAAAVGVGQSMYQPHYYIDVNLSGTALLLDLLANEKHHVQKLIVASSMSIYGEGSYQCARCGKIQAGVSRSLDQLKGRDWEPKCPRCSNSLEAIPTDESKVIESSSIYAISKRVQEEMVLMMGKTYSIPSFALRYFNVYGPRQSLSNPYTGVAAIFLSRILNGNRPMIFEDGNQSRDFIHVRDIARANLACLESKQSGQYALNVGCGHRISVNQIAEILIRKLDPKLSSEVVFKFREGDIRHCYSDPSAIARLLGYKPEMNFESGLDDLIDWCRAEQASDKVGQSYDELAARGLVR
ncbi:MAG: GDP-mannose 4,6-dehydratase [Acidobacteriia bacterium]|nr:GDP-mannose 4,6-dehydratase [Terriglobia bacterium]